MPILSELPPDVLVVIAKKLTNLQEFVCFGSVSKSLFAAAKDDFFEGIRLLKRTPYLLLPVRDDGDDDDVRELYSLVDGESIVASVKAPSLKTKKCFESLGWLLAVGEDGNMSLFDPFSDTPEIPLPHQTTFPRYDGLVAHVFIRKMVLSARPSETSDFILMVIGSGYGDLSYWRPGDKTWNKMKQQQGAFDDVVYHSNGLFYAIGYPGFVWVFDLSGKKKNKRIKSRMLTDFSQKDPERGLVKGLVAGQRLYVLKADNTLLFIIRTTIDFFGTDDSSHMTKKFQVY